WPGRTNPSPRTPARLAVGLGAEGAPTRRSAATRPGVLVPPLPRPAGRGIRRFEISAPRTGTGSLKRDPTAQVKGLGGPARNERRPGPVAGQGWTGSGRVRHVSAGHINTPVPVPVPSAHGPWCLAAGPRQTSTGAGPRRRETSAATAAVKLSVDS